MIKVRCQVCVNGQERHSCNTRLIWALTELASRTRTFCRDLRIVDTSRQQLISHELQISRPLQWHHLTFPPSSMLPLKISRCCLQRNATWAPRISKSTWSLTCGRHAPTASMSSILEKPGMFLPEMAQRVCYSLPVPKKGVIGTQVNPFPLRVSLSPLPSPSIDPR